jgi:hypothetical protein
MTRRRAGLVVVGAIEAASVTARAEAADLRTVADDVAAQVTAVTKERDDAGLAAFFANGRVGTLRTCLDGINRALNQVLDSCSSHRSISTLAGR